MGASLRIGSQIKEPNPALRLADLKSSCRISLALGVPIITIGMDATFTRVTKKLRMISAPPDFFVFKCWISSMIKSPIE